MARLTKADLADRSRYVFKEEEVEIEELGGSVQIRSLSVKQRNGLPSISSKMKPEKRLRALAEMFSIAVSDPDLTVDEAMEFFGDLPAEAVDEVLEQFGELLGLADEDEEVAARRSEFHTEDDE